MTRTRVLFLCTGNACRSQMAEGFCRHRHGARIVAASAGIVATRLDPRAVRVMAERGVDISAQRSEALGLDHHGRLDWVVTVCDDAAERCPLPPAGARRLHRSFPDPPALAAALDDEAQILAVYREVRDAIEAFVRELPERLAAAR